MRISPRVSKTVVAAVLAAGALAAPVTTTTATALPPCCGVDDIANYYATPDMTGSIVGQHDDGGDCAFTNWGQVTPYVKYTTLYCSTQ